MEITSCKGGKETDLDVYFMVKWRPRDVDVMLAYLFNTYVNKEVKEVAEKTTGNEE